MDRTLTLGEKLRSAKAAMDRAWADYCDAKRNYELCERRMSEEMERLFNKAAQP